MASDIETMEAAIAAQARTAVSGAEILTAIDEAQLGTVRTRTTVIDVVWIGSSFQRSAEIGAVRQAERPRWGVYVEVNVSKDTVSGRERAYQAIDDLRATLCPVTGWAPDAYSGFMELENVEFLGLTQSGRLYLMTFAHDRWEG